MADSLESFDETTTAACPGSDVPKRRVALKSSDLAIFDTEYPRADGLGACAAPSAVNVALGPSLAI
jgi:hypothetical protein